MRFLSCGKIRPFFIIFCFFREHSLVISNDEIFCHYCLKLDSIFHADLYLLFCIHHNFQKIGFDTFWNKLLGPYIKKYESMKILFPLRLRNFCCRLQQKKKSSQWITCIIYFYFITIEWNLGASRDFYFVSFIIYNTLNCNIINHLKLIKLFVALWELYRIVLIRGLIIVICMTFLFLFL